VHPAPPNGGHARRLQRILATRCLRGVMTTARATPAPRLPVRLTSLDGLRGVAAVIVLAHHALLTVPLLARAYYPAMTQVPEGSAAWWLSFTPLHLAWAGTEAVFLFFVLSGLVVTLPALRSPGFDWIAFYPRRVIRIYGPVAVALLLGVALMLLVPRFDDRVLGHWMNTRPNSAPVGEVLTDLGLVEGTSGIVSPLWSLQWEILFSAFLPLFVGIAVVGRRRPRAAAALVAAAVVVGAVLDVKSLFYLSLFAIGSLLVASWDRVAAAGRRLSRRRWVWPVLVAAAALCSTATWTMQGLGVTASTAATMRWVEVPGVVLLLLAAAFWRPAVRLLDRRLFQWLGRISFSLYLVHEPIVTASRFALVHLHAPTWVSILVAVPVSFAVAALFARLVEAPFHRLSRAVGRRVSSASRDAVHEQHVPTEGAPRTPPPAARAPRRRSTLV
jgi:peptidoglycan/LPS O-acetylase OafA/YrhL